MFCSYIYRTKHNMSELWITQRKPHRYIQSEREEVAREGYYPPMFLRGSQNALCGHVFRGKTVGWWDDLAVRNYIPFTHFQAVWILPPLVFDGHQIRMWLCFISGASLTDSTHTPLTTRMSQCHYITNVELWRLHISNWGTLPYKDILKMLYLSESWQIPHTPYLYIISNILLST